MILNIYRPIERNEKIMNGFNAAALLMLFGGVGGIFNGLLNYGGFVMPASINGEVPTPDGKKNLPVQMLMPGVLGSVGLGAISGFIVFLYIQKNVWIFQDLVQPPTGGQGMVALGFGLAGSVAIDELISRVQQYTLGKTVEVAKQMSPDIPQPTPQPNTELVELENLMKTTRRPTVAMARFM